MGESIPIGGAIPDALDQSPRHSNKIPLNTTSWDRANRLVEWDNGVAADLTAYAYDGLGNRIAQSLGTTSPTITKYLLDLQPGLAVILSETTGANTTRYVHGLRGLHAQEDNAGNWTWPLEDGLGSVVSVVNNSVVPQESRQYTPYGEMEQLSGSSQTVYGFTGEPTDGGVGLTFLRARYLNPSIGQFISLDPRETPNRYAYVDGNPVNDAVGELKSSPPNPLSIAWQRGRKAGAVALKNRFANNAVNRVDPSGLLGFGPALCSDARCNERITQPRSKPAPIPPPPPRPVLNRPALCADRNCNVGVSVTYPRPTPAAPVSTSRPVLNRPALCADRNCNVGVSVTSLRPRPITTSGNTSSIPNLLELQQTTGSACPPGWTTIGTWAQTCLNPNNPGYNHDPALAWEVYQGQVNANNASNISQQRMEECAKKAYGCSYDTGVSWWNIVGAFVAGGVASMAAAAVIDIAPVVASDYLVPAAKYALDKIVKYGATQIGGNAIAGAGGYILGILAYNRITPGTVNDKPIEVEKIIQYAAYGAVLGTLNQGIDLAFKAAGYSDLQAAPMKAPLYSQVGMLVASFINIGVSDPKDQQINMLSGSVNGITAIVPGWIGVAATTASNAFFSAMSDLN